MVPAKPRLTVGVTSEFLQGHVRGRHRPRSERCRLGRVADAAADVDVTAAQVGLYTLVGVVFTVGGLYSIAAAPSGWSIPSAPRPATSRATNPPLASAAPRPGTLSGVRFPSGEMANGQWIGTTRGRMLACQARGSPMHSPRNLVRNEVSGRTPSKSCTGRRLEAVCRRRRPGPHLPEQVAPHEPSSLSFPRPRSPPSPPPPSPAPL